MLKDEDILCTLLSSAPASLRLFSPLSSNQEEADRLQDQAEVER